MFGPKQTEDSLGMGVKINVLQTLCLPLHPTNPVWVLRLFQHYILTAKIMDTWSTQPPTCGDRSPENCMHFFGAALLRPTNLAWMLEPLQMYDPLAGGSYESPCTLSVPMTNHQGKKACEIAFEQSFQL